MNKTIIGCVKNKYESAQLYKNIAAHPLSHPYDVSNMSVKTKQIFKTCPPSNSLRPVTRAR